MARRKPGIYKRTNGSFEVKKRVPHTDDWLRKTVPTYAGALVVLEDFERRIAVMRGSGMTDVDATRRTFADAADGPDGWWNAYIVPNKAAATERSYRQQLDKHVLPRLGKTRLLDVVCRSSSGDSWIPWRRQASATRRSVSPWP